MADLHLPFFIIRGDTRYVYLFDREIRRAFFYKIQWACICCGVFDTAAVAVVAATATAVVGAAVVVSHAWLLGVYIFSVRLYRALLLF